MSNMTNWRTLLGDAMKARGEAFADIVENTMSDADMDKMFDAGLGGPEGIPFTVLTHKTVYFPFEYDGAESVGFVARDPDGKPTEHWG